MNEHMPEPVALQEDIVGGEIILQFPQKTTISIEDFAKIDVRIGRILTAEKVPETDKLIKCTIDFGELGTRTIVSGIAGYRIAESLPGTQCIYVVNLAPRTIKGIESQGMLMAASTSDGSFALLSPDSSIPAGTPLK
jgi:methionyl-tRNA synthetase